MFECRYLMIFALSKPPVAFTACATTGPTAYASATSPFTPAGVPPYNLMYSATIPLLFLLAARPYHVLGTITPSALAAPTALMKVLPWSGPAVAMKTFGEKPDCSNACMNADTVGTSVLPKMTTCGLAAATASAIGVKSVTSEGNTWL